MAKFLFAHKTIYQIFSSDNIRRFAELFTGLFTGLVAGLLIATSAQALPYTPSSPQQIVARWKPGVLSNTNASIATKNSGQALQMAKNYLATAALPGEDNRYSQAQALLKPFMSQNPVDAQLWYTWARILQHQHQFAAAQAALTEVFKRDPRHVGANLLAARIALIQGDISQAKQQCVKLLGQVDLITLSACSLEAQSYGDDTALLQSYQQLQNHFHRDSGNQDNIWIRQILADMALRLNDPHTALGYLLPIPQDASVSLLSQWADIQLALHNEQAILAKLGPIVQNTLEQDDALLVRLALAEKSQNSEAKFWQEKVAEKIQLRELRGDKQHAADMCIFYLDLQPSAAKALAWAQINWQQAREPADRNLLERASAFANL